MLRAMLVTVAVVVCTLADARPVQAAEAPWCAVISVGVSGVYEDCRYSSFAECQPNVIAGNRGFCNQNPRWAGWYAPASEPRIRRKRHAQRY